MVVWMAIIQKAAERVTWLPPRTQSFQECSQRHRLWVPVWEMAEASPVQPVQGCHATRFTAYRWSLPSDPCEP